MPQDSGENEQEGLQAWIRSQLDAAAKELLARGIVDSSLVEAKPAWAFPYQLLIGKFRAQGEPREFKWFICGDAPTDHVDSTAASTPREAARHFAMKWQLHAARQAGDSSEKPGGQLADRAEALYELVDDESLWEQKGGF